MELLLNLVELAVLRGDFVNELLSLHEEFRCVGIFRSVLHEAFPILVDLLEEAVFGGKNVFDFATCTKNVFHINPSVLQLDPSVDGCAESNQIFLHLLSFGTELGSVATRENHVDVGTLSV